MATLLRTLGAGLAVVFTVATCVFFYQAFFVLERFGLMAILSALALFSAATLVWWLLAEGHIPRTRARIRHILSGALMLATVGLIASFIMSWPHINTGFFSGLTFEAPVGFIIGGNLGALYSLLRLRSTPAI